MVNSLLVSCFKINIIIVVVLGEVIKDKDLRFKYFWLLLIFVKLWSWCEFGCEVSIEKILVEFFGGEVYKFDKL